MSELAKRLATALVLVPPLIALVWWGPLWSIACVLGFFVAGGLYEMCLLGESTVGVEPSSPIIRFLPVLVGLGAYAGWIYCPAAHHLQIGFCALLSLVAIRFYSSKSVDKCAAQIAFDLLAIFYVAALVALMVHTAGEPDGERVGRRVVLAMLFVVWLGDSGAYFVGRAIGAHKLAPQLSPNKTIEGSLGGLVGSVGAMVGMKLLLDLPGSWLWIVVFGLVGGAIEQLGDLFESAIKRNAGVKDSGTFFPGHGGFLDRLDAILFAAPVFSLYPWLVT
ncbi:MAG: phosphatidate cytidylyltransferase [Myxococcales bacterium]|nr:phosphatidate cytidylyltransferase [Myxococcales bacterium]|tara:strand:+ start:625 stop:1455 length:831 start_codon:yes stop_codon:yes gene_type:complete